MGVERRGGLHRPSSLCHPCLIQFHEQVLLPSIDGNYDSAVNDLYDGSLESPKGAFDDHNSVVRPDYSTRFTPGGHSGVLTTTFQVVEASEYWTSHPSNIMLQRLYGVAVKSTISTADAGFDFRER
jgi:hypothetical protein